MLFYFVLRYVYLPIVIHLSIFQTIYQRKKEKKDFLKSEQISKQCDMWKYSSGQNLSARKLFFLY